MTSLGEVYYLHRSRGDVFKYRAIEQVKYLTSNSIVK